MANPNTSIELNALSEFFKNSWRFFQQTVTGEHKFNKLPWYWVIGPTGAGKTLFVNQAELELIPTKHLATDPKDESEHNKRCNWWVCDKAIVLDIPGSYLATKNTSSRPINWRQFLNLSQKYLQKKPPAGIILTLALPEWVEQSKTSQQALTQRLRHAFLLLSKQLKTYCPIYLVLTHADKVIGFNEFFADLGQEERQEAWGFNLTEASLSHTQSLPGLFKTRFDQLLKRLHDRIIWRAHQERNLQKRALIQHFPWQLESLKAGLATFIYQMSDVLRLAGPTPLQGVYFVSNTRQGQPVDCVPKTATGGLTVTTNPADPFVSNATKQTAYFSHQLLEKIIFSQNSLTRLRPQLRRQNKLRLGAYIAAGGLVLTSSLLMAHNLNSKVALLDNAETAFVHYESLAKKLAPTNPNLSQTLPALNALADSADAIHQAHLPWVMQDLHRSSSLSALSDKIYQRALTSYFLPALGQQLTHVLSTSNDPNDLYSALRIYLMLGDPSHFDSRAIKNWFITYWGDALSDCDLQKKLITHLNVLVSHPLPALVLDQQLIGKIRTVLNNTPYPQMAYSILKSKSNATLFNPFQLDTPEQTAAFDKVFTLADNNTAISSLFTAKHFADTYFQQIPAVCNAVTQGDWVLGYGVRADLDPRSKQELIANVRNLYLQDYTAHWQKLLTHLTVVHWKNLPQAVATLNVLAEDKSPLVQILQVAAANTNLAQLVPNPKNIAANDLETIKTNLTQQFTDLAKITPHDIEQALTDIHQLQDYLAPIAAAADVNQAAFNAAKTRFAQKQDNNKDPIEKLLTRASLAPKPLQLWLTSLANNAWGLVLNQTALYLNTAWRNQVVNYYNTNLNGRYPLIKTSKQDVALAHFTEFFAPDGVMNNYFKDYLSPFIDTSAADWTYRAVDGQTLHLSADLLPQLERSALIRTMFFNTNQHLAVTFSLQPLALEPGVTDLTLVINGQTMADAQEQITSPHIFTWPGTAAQQYATLVFTNKHGEHTTNTITGPWALFRLLDQANLQTSTNTKSFELIFDLNGNSARYQLLANNLINPFIPGVIDGFRCPVSLQ